MRKQPIFSVTAVILAAILLSPTGIAMAGETSSGVVFQYSKLSVNHHNPSKSDGRKHVHREHRHMGRCRIVGRAANQIPGREGCRGDPCETGTRGRAESDREPFRTAGSHSADRAWFRYRHRSRCCPVRNRIPRLPVCVRQEHAIRLGLQRFRSIRVFKVRCESAALFWSSGDGRNPCCKPVGSTAG